MMNLPEDIIMEILSRLSVKSLLQLRCVCKALRTLISHPRFVKIHLRRQQELPAIGLIYPRSKDDPSQNDDDSAVDVDLESLLGLRNENAVTILDSCHGLLCIDYRFHSHHFFGPSRELMLWNPSTRQRNHIPNPSFGGHVNYLFCFLYDSDADDYKIVRILYLQAIKTTLVDVFSLKSNEWRTIEETHASLIMSGPAMYFNGNIHWIAHSYEHKRGLVIAAFSIREEKFLEMELPCQRYITKLMVLGECLYVGGVYSAYGESLSCLEMWVMEEYGIKESWKKVTCFPYSVGEDLNGSLPVVLRFLENGLFLVAHDKKLVLCDPKNSTWKNITSYKKAEYYRKEVSLYVETLVSPYCGDGGSRIPVQ